MPCTLASVMGSRRTLLFVVFGGRDVHSSAMVNLWSMAASHLDASVRDARRDPVRIIVHANAVGRIHPRKCVPAYRVNSSRLTDSSANALIGRSATSSDRGRTGHSTGSSNVRERSAGGARQKMQQFKVLDTDKLKNRAHQLSEGISAEHTH